jgi:hypothetical protein
VQLATLRPDGMLRTPVTIWVVRHGDDLYVRSYRGPGGSWYRRTRQRRDGHIQGGGVDKDVTFAGAGRGLDDQIGAEYRARYCRYSATCVDPIVSPPLSPAILATWAWSPSARADRAGPWRNRVATSRLACCGASVELTWCGNLPRACQRRAHSRQRN